MGVDLRAPVRSLLCVEALFAHLLRVLEPVNFSDLNADDRVCLICQERYFSGTSPEFPIRLLCGHTLGVQCFFTWLSPWNPDHHDSCPCCRSPLVLDWEFVPAAILSTPYPADQPIDTRQRRKDANEVPFINSHGKPPTIYKWPHLETEDSRSIWQICIMSFTAPVFYHLADEKTNRIEGRTITMMTTQYCKIERLERVQSYNAYNYAAIAGLSEETKKYLAEKYASQVPTTSSVVGELHKDSSNPTWRSSYSAYAMTRPIGSDCSKVGTLIFSDPSNPIPAKYQQPLERMLKDKLLETIVKERLQIKSNPPPKATVKPRARSESSSTQPPDGSPRRRLPPYRAPQQQQPLAQRSSFDEDGVTALPSADQPSADQPSADQQQIPKTKEDNPIWILCDILVRRVESFGLINGTRKMYWKNIATKFIDLMTFEDTRAESDESLDIIGEAWPKEMAAVMKHTGVDLDVERYGSEMQMWSSWRPGFMERIGASCGTSSM